MTAYFEIIEYDDSQVEINSTTGGNVISESEADGTFAHFSTYELNASASRGYQFDEWRVDIDDQDYILNGLNNPINEVKIEGPIAITAVFSLTPYQLNILASIGGQTTGPSSFTIQESPLITAIANEGWDFSHWTGDISYLSDPNSSSRPTFRIMLSLNLRISPLQPNSFEKSTNYMYQKRVRVPLTYS